MEPRGFLAEAGKEAAEAAQRDETRPEPRDHLPRLHSSMAETALLER